MTTLIYRRSHSDDPDPETGGIFGINGCMKSVRSYKFDAVIGVGGKFPWPDYKGIAKKLNWVEIGPKKVGTHEDGHPQWAFEYFLYYGEKGPLLEKEYPKLAKYMFDLGNIPRQGYDGRLPEEVRDDVQKILDLAKDAPPSPQKNTNEKSKQNSGCGKHMISCS
jgi:hypothetical protein